MNNLRIVYLPPPPPGKSRGAAIFLALFFGFIGIHKFYLESPWQGLLYLLFSWTFLPAIIGFLEVIVYLSMSTESFQLKYTPGLKKYNDDLKDINNN